MDSPNLVRRSPFDSPGDASPKRRKLDHGAKPYDSADDSGNELFATYSLEPTLEPTLRLDPPAFPPKEAAAGWLPSSVPQSSSPPASYVTQPTQIPTQIMHPGRSVTPPFQPSAIVQVQASSPVRPHATSPLAQPPSVNRPPILQPDGTVKPFDFYPAKPKVSSINLDTEAPQYIGSSSEGEGSDHEIKPSFGPTTVRKPIPSVSQMHERQSSISSQPEKVDKVSESPISMNSLAAQFAYTGPGRLDSIKKTPFGAITPGTFRTQRRPEPARPVGQSDVTAFPNNHYKLLCERAKLVVPNKSMQSILKAMIDKKGNYDDAMELLTSDDTIDLTGEDGRAAQLKTLNRGAGAGRVAIKDKYGKTLVATTLEPSPPPGERPSRRKLVRGRERPTSPLPSPPRRRERSIEIADDSDSAAEVDDDSEDERETAQQVLNYLNTCSQKELSDLACTTEEIGEVIVAQRPFSTLDDIREVRGMALPPTGKGKKGKGAKTRPIGDKVVDVALETWRGYSAVDSLIFKVEQLGKPIAEAIKKWGVDIVRGSGELEMTEIRVESDASSAKDSGIGTPTATDASEAPPSMADLEGEVHGTKRTRDIGFMKDQPRNLRDGVVLKDYQIAGVNWLNLLYEKKLSCILADEMGLGKTCQVISFLAHLLSKGITGPHLIVVPSSTLENWLREFANFCPELKVEPYYGSQKDRPAIRMALQKNKNWNVLVTTYQLATGDRLDRAFLKNMSFNCCVYDEGHMLKNSSSARYDALIKLPAEYRLLLTGTPLQNNLQELASLLAFILPSVFEEKKEELRSIFKYKAKTTDDEESNSVLLSQQRISRARAMMTPFVLRRKKQQVLKHLPGKTSRVEYCTMNDLQQKIYFENISSAQDAIKARAEGKKPTKTTTNVMMELRKAAIHPLLFRKIYPDDRLKKMSKDIMKEEYYRNNDQMYILEDMECMNDLELNRLCLQFPKTLGKYALKKDEWMDSGKVEALKTLLQDMQKNGDRVLVFSQFTQILDILEMVLSTLDMGFLRIDGSTPVDARQDLIDQYHEETDIIAFLLSTKAGGFGINLACANKVVIFDSSFNPHDDAQASDRAHRVGQTRDVEVIRLITKDTIEEQILQLANTKLALDQSISEGDEKTVEGKAEELVAKMLLAKTEGVPS